MHTDYNYNIKTFNIESNNSDGLRLDTAMDHVGYPNPFKCIHVPNPPIDTARVVSNNKLE